MSQYVISVLQKYFQKSCVSTYEGSLMGLMELIYFTEGIHLKIEDITTAFDFNESEHIKLQLNYQDGGVQLCYHYPYKS